MKKRMILRIFAAFLLLAALFATVSCAAKEETLVPEGMQSATAYGATYRLYVPTTWSLKILPGISGAYYNVMQQSAVSVAEYPIDETLSTELSALDENTSRIGYYFEKNLLAQTKLMATGEVKAYNEDCIATTLGGANARQYHHCANVAGEVTHFLHIIAEKDNRFYVFSFTATEDLYTYCMDDVKKMLENFAFGKEYTPTDAIKNFPTDANAPTGMKIASGDEVEYLFFVPESWSPNETSNVYAATAPDGSFVSVVPYLPSSEGISVEGYFEKSEEIMKTTSGTLYKRLDAKETTFGGGKALQYEYEYTVGGVTYRYLQIIIGYKSMIYNLTYTALPQNFEANRADVEAIIAAFTFR
ncbi:MAG: DUF1795 domain-containing protein [Ruminococcaceae bacterium]|nr:DUF1795 domain-containing protein [Oscillospiraceae bacterium]